MQDIKLPEPEKVIDEEEIARIIEQSQDIAASQARRDADKFLRKNKREITRLNKVAYDSVLDNNFPAYEYALKKLRDFYKQPYTDELIQMQWVSTRKTVWNIVNDYTDKIQTTES